jgi:hypothetical protein
MPRVLGAQSCRCRYRSPRRSYRRQLLRSRVADPSRLRLVVLGAEGPGPEIRQSRDSRRRRLSAGPDALRRQACVARISGTSTCRSIGPSKQSRALAPTRVSRPPQARLPVEAEVRVRAGRCAAPERARSPGTSPARHTHFAIKQNCAARSPGDTLATTKETGPAVGCSLGSLPSGANQDTDER